MSKQPDFIVECNVCGIKYENWIGSTPCCGSIAYLIDENGQKTQSFMLFGSINNSPITPIQINEK